jgi:hypothetical protein
MAAVLNERVRSHRIRVILSSLVLFALAAATACGPVGTDQLPPASSTERKTSTIDDSPVAGAVLTASSDGRPKLKRASKKRWKKYSPRRADYPQRVDFVVECYFVADRPDDPIVQPGRPGASHRHTFGGNSAVSAHSTPESLVGQDTNCKLDKNTASYWMPTIYNDSVAVYPARSRAYYRAGSFRGSSVQPMPFGLKMVAGDAMAMTPQSPRIAGFQCRDRGGNTVRKRARVIRCPVGDFLEASVTFPNCWNGRDLDSTDHKSHMAYADWKTRRCPRGFPVQIPQLTYANRYPVNALRGKITLATMMDPSMDSTLTLHADVLDAWEQATMELLTKRCINRSIACADVTNTRMPPG